MSERITETGQSGNVSGELTPMQAAYCRMKAQLPDSLLCIRLGDFYEFFFDDAKVAAKALNVALTKRKDVPMAGIPSHATDKYFSTLILAGHRVAVCENITSETPVYFQPEGGAK